MSIRTYDEMSKLKTHRERFEYLRLDGIVGQETFGFDRYLNQQFYKDEEWLRVRNDVIIRDEGCDLGVEGYEINSTILVHHMNPITAEDIINRVGHILDPQFLICTTKNTHKAIHYGDVNLLDGTPIERTPNDTVPWR